MPEKIITTDLQVEKLNLETPQSISNYYRSIINCLPNNVYWLDRNCITKGCNNNVLKFVGLKSMDQFIGISYEEMGRLAGWTEGQANSFKRDDMEVMETGIPKINNEEPTFYDDMGNPIYYMSTRVPLFNEHNEVIGVVGISVDITERKKNEVELKKAREKAEAANAAKTEFLENMRHDLRTPLAGIVGVANLIQEETLGNPKVAEYVGNMNAASQALMDNINDILEVIKISSGEIPVEKRKCNLKHKLLRAITLMTPQANLKNIALDFMYDDDIPDYVITDARRIHNITLQLISNALKFTEQGYVKVLVKLHHANKNDFIIKIIVKDTGIGIQEDQQKNIFSDFKRLSPAFKGIYKGMGLGLTLVKEFIADLNGEIYVESEVNKGSIFTCVIPLKSSLIQDEEGCEIIKSEELTPILQHITENFFESIIHDKFIEVNLSRILVVEDDCLVGSIVKKILQNLNCHVDIAKTAKEAIFLAELSHYDLIFMDIGLPDYDGFEVTKQLRLKVKLFNTPIVALSAHADTDDDYKQRCIESGMTAVFSKPLSKETADAIIRSFIINRNKVSDLRHARKNDNKESNIIKTKDFDSLSICDKEAAKILLNIDVEQFDELLKEFIQSVPEMLEKITVAYKNNDFVLVSDLAHQLKGTASYFEAEQIKNIAEELQHTKGNNDNFHLDILYNALIKAGDTFNKYCLKLL